MKIINIFLVSALFTVVAVPVAIGCNCQQKASAAEVMYRGSPQHQNFEVNEGFIQGRSY